MRKLIIAVIVLSIGYFAIAKAEETKSVTPQEFIGAVASVPGKELGRDQVQVAGPEREIPSQLGWNRLGGDFNSLHPILFYQTE